MLGDISSSEREQKLCLISILMQKPAHVRVYYMKIIMKTFLSELKVFTNYKEASAFIIPTLTER